MIFKGAYTRSSETDSSKHLRIRYLRFFVSKMYPKILLNKSLIKFAIIMIIIMVIIMVKIMIILMIIS